MPFGGFCPLPLRLGGDPLVGVSAEQWARLSADLTAQVRTAPFAVMTYDPVGPTVISYQAQHGIGIVRAPSGVLAGASAVTWTWNLNYTNDYDEITPTRINYAMATAHGATAAFARVQISNTSEMKVTTFDAAGSEIAVRTTIVVY